MKIIVQVEPNDFVAKEELDPLRDAIQGEAETHVGHLCDDIVVEVQRPT